MPALSRLEVEAKFRGILNRVAAKAGPGAHTVWEQYTYEPRQLKGFQIYRATMNHTTPVVIWLDEHRGTIMATLIYRSGTYSISTAVEPRTDTDFDRIEEAFRFALQS